MPILTLDEVVFALIALRKLVLPREYNDAIVLSVKQDVLCNSHFKDFTMDLNNHCCDCGHVFGSGHSAMASWGT